MNTLHAILSNPIVHGALAGLWGAVLVDLRVFMTWKSADDAKSFDYKVAAIRWAQGAVGGALFGMVGAGLASASQ